MVDNRKMRVALEKEIETAPEGVHVPDPNLKPWTEMTWEDVRDEYCRLVRRVLKSSRGTNYIYTVKPPEVATSIEEDCIAGLDSIVNKVKSTGTKGAMPDDCDWYAVVWDYDIKSEIKQRVEANKLLQEHPKLGADVIAFNASIAVGDEYIAVIDNHNEITVFPRKSSEHQSDQ